MIARDAWPALDTERLVLRELTDDDAPAIAGGAGDPRVARFLVQVPSPYPVVLARRWIAARVEWWPQQRGVTFAIARRDTPAQLIGTTSLRRSASSRRAELGYWLTWQTWGNGYATEACRAVVDFGFARLNLARIHAQVIAGNTASCRVLDKLGMVCEGVLRSHVRKDGARHDLVLYGLLRDEWRRR
jgi:[ribosomal protein S5]-alanine N-acetyltransferase